MPKIETMPLDWFLLDEREIAHHDDPGMRPAIE